MASELGPIALHNGGWEIDLYVGSFARTFGARAPLKWIARRLFDDSVGTKAINEESARLSFAHESSTIVDSEFLSDLNQAIQTILCDWRLADTNFFIGLRAFEEWRDVLEDSIMSDYIDYFETWHDEKTEDGLLEKHAEIREAIEARAIELGL